MYIHTNKYIYMYVRERVPQQNNSCAVGRSGVGYFAARLVKPVSFFLILLISPYLFL